MAVWVTEWTWVFIIIIIIIVIYEMRSLMFCTAHQILFL